MESAMQEHTLMIKVSDGDLKELSTQLTGFLKQNISVRDVQRIFLMVQETCDLDIHWKDSRPVPPLLLAFWKSVDSFLERDPSLNFSCNPNEIAFQMPVIKELLMNNGWDSERIKSAKRLLIFDSPHPLLKKNHSKRHHVLKHVARCWIFKRINMEN